MKTLFVIRHAKSSWKDPSLRDFDRPLNTRGKNAAPLMAERTVERGERLEFLLSSGAKRAVSTAHEFHRVFPDAELHTENAIYEARVSDLLQVVNKLPNDKGVVALFGHNPGFSQLVDYLCDYAMHLPTAGLVKINFELDSWELVSESTGEIEYIDYPKNGNT